MFENLHDYHSVSDFFEYSFSSVLSNEKWCELGAIDASFRQR